MPRAGPLRYFWWPTPAPSTSSVPSPKPTSLIPRVHNKWMTGWTFSDSLFEKKTDGPPSQKSSTVFWNLSIQFSCWMTAITSGCFLQFANASRLGATECAWLDIQAAMPGKAVAPPGSHELPQPQWLVTASFKNPKTDFLGRCELCAAPPRWVVQVARHPLLLGELVRTPLWPAFLDPPPQGRATQNKARALGKSRVRRSSKKNSAVQRSAVQRSAVQCSAVQCSALQQKHKKKQPKKHQHARSDRSVQSSRPAYWVLVGAARRPSAFHPPPLLETNHCLRTFPQQGMWMCVVLCPQSL